MAVTCLILWASLRVLLQVPAMPVHGNDAVMRLALLPRRSPARDRPHPMPTSTESAARSAMARPAMKVKAPVSKPAQALPARASGQGEALAQRLYTHEGRVRMADMGALQRSAIIGRPPGLENERDLQRAKAILERVNPIDYKETRFAKDWASDGNLLQVADQAMAAALKKMKNGSSASPAVARPPPEVRFNPALHERASDLGSDLTGDAYKAAPIAFEKAPDLRGEASRRIRQSLGELENRYTRCGRERIKALMTPVLAHLQALERVEHAMAHGADPIRVANLLPREADTAYDLSRRALWYAQSRLEACK